MKIVFCILLLSIVSSLAINAQNFDDHFENKTLRIDYTFSGKSGKQFINVDEMIKLPHWAGRKHHLSQLPLEGNGQIEMRDEKSGKIIYRTSFATLFQEWLSTDEAKTTSRSFENTYLLPYPKQPVIIKITLINEKKEVSTVLEHSIKPNDILIRKEGTEKPTSNKNLLQSGSTDECIDVVILAEGYTENEMDTFYRDAQIAMESIFAYEPFKKLKSRFNFIAVASPSKDSGVSVPKENIWKNTAFSSHFSTFYSDRYLTTNRLKNIHNTLTGIPYEHIIILANTDVYGGGGIYNAFTLTTAHHKSFQPVVVHEFGHSFGGLADEYFYEKDLFSDTYPFDKEPWEQNITTLVNFPAKWKDMLPEGTPTPTNPKESKKYPVGLYEGGGYSAKGIYRPSADCRMRSNPAETFCPVCQRALERLISFYTDNN